MFGQNATRWVHCGGNRVLADDRRVDPHFTESERLEHRVANGLRVLRGVQDGTEVDTLPGQASPQRLESVTGLTVARSPWRG